MKKLSLASRLRSPLPLATASAILLLMLASLTASYAHAVGAAAATHISGDISNNTTWTVAGSPYVIDVPITVVSTATLTIEAGVEVQFKQLASLTIAGGLNAQGAHARQVVMSGEGTTSWPGLIVAPSARRVILQSVTISNAITGLAISPVPPGAAPRVDVLDSLFMQNGTGISADYSGAAGPRLTMRNNLLYGNDVGLRLIGSPKPGTIKLNHNSFVGNGIGLASIAPGAGNPTRARQQWWNSPAGPRYAASCPQALPPHDANQPDLVCGAIDYTPWSRVPAGRAIVPANQGVTIETAIGQGALSDSDTQPTSVLTLTVPAGAFSQTVDLIAATRDFSTLPPPPGKPTQLSFEITAAANGREIHQFAAGRQLTLEIRYLATDIGTADVRKLMVNYYDEARGTWSFAGIATTPDPANQRVYARLSHLSRMRITSENLLPVWIPLLGR